MDRHYTLKLLVLQDVHMVMFELFYKKRRKDIVHFTFTFLLRREMAICVFFFWIGNKRTTYLYAILNTVVSTRIKSCDCKQFHF